MRKVVLLAFAVSTSLSCLSLLSHPYVYADQALQLTAVQAWDQSESPFPNWIVSADPADLSRDRSQWELWHAPGFPLLVAALECRPGLAVQLVTIPCFIAGCIGWSLWALHFALPRRTPLAFACLLPGIRYGNDNLVHFHAEAFLFAATPWLLLGAIPIGRPVRACVTSSVKAAAFGLALGTLFLFKYSAMPVIAGILGMLLAQAGGKSPPRLLFIALFAALPVSLLSAVNRHWGGAENIVSASWHLHFPAEGLLHLAGTIPLTLADGGQVLEAALLNPRYGVFVHPGIVPLFGLPGALFLVFLFLRKKQWPETDRLTLLFAATSPAVMLLVWCLCYGVGYDRRYLAPASLALLPLVLSEIFATRPGRWRILGSLFVVAYILLPIAYGYATFAWKLRASAIDRVASSGIWNPILSDRDDRAADAFLNAQLTDPASDLWYLPEPLLALDLRGRRILGHPTWNAAQTGETTYRTSRPLRILALAPPETDAKSAAYLSRIFPKSSGWQKESIPGANYVLWTGRLFP